MNFRKTKFVLPLLMISVMVLAIPISTAAENTHRKVFISYNGNAGAEIRQLVESVGGRVNYQYRLIPALSVDLPGWAVKSLMSHPKINYVEPVMVRYSEAHIIPGVLYTGSPEVLPWGVERVRANEVWDSTPFDGDPDVAIGRPAGQGVNVAVLDSGLDEDHPDLVPPALGDTFDFIDGGSIDDTFPPSHGTATTGIVAARDNDIGVIGVAPKATIFHYRVCGEPMVVDCPLDAIVAAVDRAVMNGAHVISMSFGGIGFSMAEKHAMHAAYVAGLLLVASAGNTASPIAGARHYPSGFPEVIAVGATTRSNTLASFSTFGGHQELVAPGVETPTTEYVGEGREAGLVETAWNPRTLSPNPMIGSAVASIVGGTLVNGFLGRSLLPGHGGVNDFAGGQCAGGDKVALISRGVITFRFKVEDAFAAGCIGAVIFNNAGTANFLGTLVVPEPIPAVSLSRPQGLALLADINAGMGLVKVNLDVIPADYNTFSGTSASAPHVSGVAALVWSANPSLTNREVRKILRATALDLGEPGRDNLFGWGLVDSFAAVACAPDPSSCPLP